MHTLICHVCRQRRLDAHVQQGAQLLWRPGHRWRSGTVHTRIVHRLSMMTHDPHNSYPEWYAAVRTAFLIYCACDVLRHICQHGMRLPAAPLRISCFKEPWIVLDCVLLACTACMRCRMVHMQVPVGSGLAFASKYSTPAGEPTPVAIAMYGDGAANQGQIWERCRETHSLWSPFF